MLCPCLARLFFSFLTFCKCLVASQVGAAKLFCYSLPQARAALVVRLFLLCGVFPINRYLICTYSPYGLFCVACLTFCSCLSCHISVYLVSFIFGIRSQTGPLMPGSALHWHTRLSASSPRCLLCVPTSRFWSTLQKLPGLGPKATHFGQQTTQISGQAVFQVLRITGGTH